MRTIALIGDPVSQSPSPAMHRAAFAALGLEMDYVAERVTKEELPAAFPRLHGRYAGLNVTRPLKELIVPLLDDVHGDAVRTGLVNTVSFLDGVSVGASTDGSGFMAALARAGHTAERAVIIGAGGSARAVAWALAASGAHVTIAARNPQRGNATAEAVGAEAISLEPHEVRSALLAADLLVNATPLGSRSPLPSGVALHRELTVFDLVYAPRATELLTAARTVGCRTIEGIEMLVEQGALSFEIWTGRRPPIEPMKDTALSALDEGDAA